MDDCTVRTMRRDEVELAIDFAAREGWNPGRHDAACFHAADPKGFFVAECDGEKVGCISAVAYGADFGFIGLFIVAPAWRGRGIGQRLWAAAMARLAGRVIGLDGVPAQQHNYRRGGFAPAWQNVRFAGVAKGGDRAGPVGAEGAALAPASASASESASAMAAAMATASATATAGRVVPLREIDLARLCADDRRVFPAPREDFLRCWVAMPEATGLAWMDDKDDRLAGWGVIRRCREGHKIGPLVADRAPIAQVLYAALCASVPQGDSVYLDIPLPNADAVALVHANGMHSVFETARMYAGPTPACELQRVYGITTFELG